jgi:hypothetical protein
MALGEENHRGEICAPLPRLDPVPFGAAHALPAIFQGAHVPDSECNGIRSIPVHGGAVSTIAASGNTAGITVDAFNVYWTVDNPVGVPTAYRIGIYDFLPPADGMFVVGTLVGQITTTPDFSSLRLPPGILQMGHQYLLTLAARQTAGPDQPNRLGVPSCYASMASGLIRP